MLKSKKTIFLLSFSLISPVIYLMLFLTSTQTHILRLSCKSIAEFPIEKKGHRLKGYVIETINKISLQQCFERCLHIRRCKSINIEKSGFGICQLNARSSHDSMDNVTLAENDRWNFYSTNFSSRLVSSSTLISRNEP